ncbi:putative trans-sialidase [Trypanosoma rangeli]|uniref:Putative trans-sialidase n=1 Tax=Trypanosoma rangeli TaxID=5698 RepID=A0A422MYC0_TRYRA|nr:putative trans-sialidase [Trypanosoma rangeli]RNE98222.1 putative trans-sialidase [Trypanosoma rangeli]|eukprot:RNE98222.1 putative trans-sialidase [Trypanosoma rangeli]
MLRSTRLWRFWMKGGDMFVEYKIMSRDHRRSLRVKGALVDPNVARTVVPLSWLEQLRSPSLRLPTGYHMEEAVYVPPAYAAVNEKAGDRSPERGTATASNAILAGPVVLYITGQNLPVVVNPYFVPDETWGVRLSGDEWDLRLGMDAIEQCTLFSELRPGGLLCNKLPSSQNVTRHEPVRATLQRYGMKCGLAESPLVPRPWTRMRYMFIDELQRGPKMTEFVGHNPRNGTPWRFSQHTKHFRLGIWRETIRRNDMNEGLHGHSSWQKSPQQAVPEVCLMAPYP